MGISNVNKAVCDRCGKTLYSMEKQIDFLKELKDAGWKGTVGRLKCDDCVSGRSKGRYSRKRPDDGKENEVNNVQLIGNLTRDPELRYSSGERNIAVCRFRIAVNDSYGNKDRTSYVNIVVFGKQAENCDRYLKKGRKVGITGRIQSGSYVNKEGRTVYTTDVLASTVEFLSPKDTGEAKPDGSGIVQQTPPSEGTQLPPEADITGDDMPPEDELYNEGFFPLEDHDIPI